jgi:cytochrome c551/c552
MKISILMIATLLTVSSTSFAGALTKDAANKIMMKSGCMTCHSIDTTKIGPAYKDVGARYATPSAANFSLPKRRKTSGLSREKNKNWYQNGSQQELDQV